MKNTKLAVYAITFLVCISWSGSVCIRADSYKQQKQGKPSFASAGRPAIAKTAAGGYAGTFNVLSYGAKGNGIADDTNAFEAAWAAACKVRGSTMVVPAGSVFLVKSVTFSGINCVPNINFQLDGKVRAPTSYGSFGSGLLQWILFTKVTGGITIKGGGIIDGQGSAWWNSNKKSPTAVRFYGSTNVKVTGIKIVNSPQTHLKFDNCVGVQVWAVSISSPANSPNTDGIHLQNSWNVIIHSTSIACGDDCISIQTGCSGIYVQNVDCGPGHGISIGGLGAGGTKACVSNVTVRDSRIQGTQTGVRIKTWQGGSGLVQGVVFSNIQVSGVDTAIVIDQYYCDGRKCGNDTSAVAVSGVSYEYIQGTYTSAAVRFACSDSTPCSGITMSAVTLDPIRRQGKYRVATPFCWKAFGELKMPISPPMNGLRTGYYTTRNGEGSC